MTFKNKFINWLGPIVAITFGILILIGSAYGEINLGQTTITGPITGKYVDDTVSISLSDTCLILITLENSPCPSYELLYFNGLDTSKIQSGSFSNSSGIFQRDPSNIKNEEQLYAYDPYTLILDPSYRMQLKTKTIYIVPSLDSYIPIDAKKKVNNTRTIYMDRITDDDCRTSTLSATNWLKSLPDTIYFMRNDCNENYTQLITKQIITDNSTEIDITTTAQYKYNLWLEDAKNKSKTKLLLK